MLEPGGVLRDINKDQESEILRQITAVEEELKEVEKAFFQDYSVQTRLRGVGIITKEKAHELGCCGPVARASGLSYDMRKLGYEAYGNLDFEPIVSNDCDSYARCAVRIGEIHQSIDLIRQAFAKMPEGDITVSVKGFPNGEYFNRIEQPRGEAIYYVKANGTKKLDRFRLRTPTFSNLAGLCEMLKDCEYSDVGILCVTIDPCISCTER